MQLSTELMVTFEIHCENARKKHYHNTVVVVHSENVILHDCFSPYFEVKRVQFLS